MGNDAGLEEGEGEERGTGCRGEMAKDCITATQEEMSRRKAEEAEEGGRGEEEEGGRGKTGPPESGGKGAKEEGKRKGPTRPNPQQHSHPRPGAA